MKLKLAALAAAAMMAAAPTIVSAQGAARTDETGHGKARRAD